MEVQIEKSWKEVLREEFEKPYFIQLTDFIRKEYREKEIFPPARYIFNAFDSCPFSRTKVVILGQDPYHEPHQAHGLSFSVKEGVQIPPSLVNIYKELENDLGISPSRSGDLSRWASQGVLLLNATLTVISHQAGSHQGKGWEEFTDAVIHQLAERKRHLVFILWGSYAQKKGAFINPEEHLVIKSAHPSPLSAYRGFFGSKPFSQTNRYLLENGEEGIDW
ncbi:MAG TPA: uracil-DNA glycosylase [Porphyromonadaceae bacterium]|nr:uracil-DNA glycosylase [Porphyromonadaceae bacterium]